VLDKAMAIVQAVVVLFTPDDLAQLRTDLLDASDGSHERKLSGQPRANVLFEAGWPLGFIQHAPSSSNMASCGA
jgi:Predicted nucleotide-binding protein containing TIR-like domain